MTRDKEQSCMELVNAINGQLNGSGDNKYKFTLEAVIHQIYELSDNTSLLCYEKNGFFAQLKTNKSKSYWDNRNVIGKNVIIKGIHASAPGTVEIIHSVRMGDVDAAIADFAGSDTKRYEEIYSTLDGLTENKVRRLMDQQRELIDFDETKAESGGDDIVTYKELVLKFTLLMKKYRRSTREIIMNIIEKYDRVSNDEKERLLKRLQFYVNYVGGVSNAVLQKNVAVVRHQLDEVFVGQDTVKDSLCMLFEAYQEDPMHRAPRIVIQANGGAGINELVCSFFKLTGMSYREFSCAGMDDVSNILGSSAVYSNATLGAFAETLLDTSQGGMLIKGVDKVKKPEVASAFQTILDGHYRNELLDTNVDVSSEWFVFTVSDLEKVNMDIDNVHVLEAKAYTDEEMKSVVRREMIRFFKENKVDEDQISFSDDVISNIALHYSRKNNIVNVQNITREVLQQALLKHGKKQKIVITNDNLKEYFRLLNEEDYFRNTYVTTVSEVEKKLMLCGDSMQDSIRNCLDKLLDDYDLAVKDEKIIIEKKIIALGNLLEKEKFSIDMSHLKEELTATISGMEDVIEKILDQIYAATLGSSIRFEPIILEGPPGVGKTSISDALGRGLGIPVIKVAFNQLSDPRELGGYPAVSAGAKPGLLGKLAVPGVSSLTAVVLFDEVDKACTPSMYNELFNMWDKQDAYDEYYGCSYSTNRLLFVCTANDLSNVPYSLKNRCQIIKVSSYSMAEQMRITRSFVIPKAMKEFGLDSEIKFTDESIRYILENYTYTSGVREIERCVCNIIRRLLRTREVCADTPIEITEDIIRECLGMPMLEMDKCPEDSIGVARALGVYGGHAGTTFGIEVADNPYGSDLEITGLAKNSFLESIKVAITVAQRMLNKEIKKIHIHTADAGTEKDGPSAGITILAALLSYMIKQPLGNVAFSGELTLNGQIHAIGGLKEKLIAAERAKTETVYIPMHNYLEMKGRNELGLFSLNIIPVASISELVSHLFPGYEFNG